MDRILDLNIIDNEENVRDFLLSHAAVLGEHANLVLPSTGRSLLSLTARLGYVKVARILMDAGASVNTKDDDGNSPLSVAIESGSLQMVELMLSRNPDLDAFAVRRAFYRRFSFPNANTKAVIERLLENGFVPRRSDEISEHVLWHAMVLDLIDLAGSISRCKRELLEYAESWRDCLLVHMRPYTQAQALMQRRLEQVLTDYAAAGSRVREIRPNLRLFRALLSPPEGAMSRVHLMSLSGNLEDYQEAPTERLLLRSILQRCYNEVRDARDEDGKTGLHSAAKIAHADLLRQLFELNLDINATDCRGKLALDYVHELLRASINLGERGVVYDAEFRHFFTVPRLENTATAFVRRIMKLRAANWYVSPRNLDLNDKVRKLLLGAPAYAETHTKAEEAEEKLIEAEIAYLKKQRLGDSTTGYDFLAMGADKLASHARRPEVLEAFLEDGQICREERFYGLMMRHNFQLGHLRHGLLEHAQNLLYECFDRRLPALAIWEILRYLTNDELMMLLKTKQ